MRAVDSPKNRMNGNWRCHSVKKNPNSFVRFLEEFTANQSAYSFIWPLEIICPLSCNRFQVAKSYWLCQHSWKPLLAWSLVKVHSMNMLAPFWDYNLVGCDTMWWARALISAGIFTCVFTKFSFHFPTIFKWMLVLSWIFCGSFITTWFNLYLFKKYFNP